MKIVIQRVSRASVTIDGQVKSAIGKGYITGIGTKLDPKGNATRAQVAVIIHRFLTK